MWRHSRVPGSYSIMDMGHEDLGRGAALPNSGQMRRISDLTADPRRRADVIVDLTARQESFALSSGRRVNGYTLNGHSPGPQIDAVEGQLIEVHLHNASVRAGITLHWHGVDVPNAEDGVAGVTQDAVHTGSSYTYRFVATHAGSYWYPPIRSPTSRYVGACWARW